ncbi:MAG: hypothetical protein I8H71_01215 [Xanthomonadaceae bacterium]|nr:hypothetical protein [Xanthomonadaceae bacterium]
MKTTIAIKLEINAPCAESKKAMLEWAFRCFRMEYDRFFIGEGHRDYRGKMDLGGSEVHTSADGKLKYEIPNLATSEGSIDVTEVLGKSEQAAVEAGAAAA